MEKVLEEEEEEVLEDTANDVFKGDGIGDVDARCC